MSRRELPQRSSRRGKRSQSCFELQGSQFLHASLSSLSLPPSLARARPPSLFHDPRSSYKPLTPNSNGPYKPTKASRLRASSAPVARAEPDYRHLARRRKESILEEKTITAKQPLRTEVPEGETLHGFLVGGRYNSAHHMDVRSLQRLGVYVPRNSSAKTFINPAGTTPPSPAIYGLKPLRKHLPLVADSSSAQTPDRGLLIVSQDLEMQFIEGTTASRHSLHSKHRSLNISTTSIQQQHSVGEAGDPVTEPTKTEDTAPESGPPVVERRSEDGESVSSVVSASNLLSPEAQLLTREILLESVGGEGPEKTSREPAASLSAVAGPSQQSLSLRSHSAGYLSQPKSASHSKRPNSALQPSHTLTSDPQRSSSIFVDLSKLHPPNTTDSGNKKQ